MQFAISSLAMAVLAMRTQAATLLPRDLNTAIDIFALPNCQKHLLFMIAEPGCQELPSEASVQLNPPDNCTCERIIIVALYRILIEEN
jgi:hypothetical protein